MIKLLNTRLLKNLFGDFFKKRRICPTFEETIEQHLYSNLNAI